jgi:hypothetical protein
MGSNHLDFSTRGGCSDILILWCFVTGYRPKKDLALSGLSSLNQWWKTGLLSQNILFICIFFKSWQNCTHKKMMGGCCVKQDWHNAAIDIVISSILAFKSRPWCCTWKHYQPRWESQHSDWLSGHELQLMTFDLCFISNLLVSTRNHPAFSLVQWFHNPLLFEWKIS